MMNLPQNHTVRQEYGIHAPKEGFPTSLDRAFDDVGRLSAVEALPTRSGHGSRGRASGPSAVNVGGHISVPAPEQSGADRRHDSSSSPPGAMPCFCCSPRLPILPALSSRACRRWRTPCRMARARRSRSSTTASGSSPAAMASACACSAVTARTGPTRCRRSRKPCSRCQYPRSHSTAKASSVTTGA